MINMFTKIFTLILLLILINGCGQQSNRTIDTQTKGEVSNTLLNIAKISYLRASHNAKINPKEFRAFSKNYRQLNTNVHKRDTNYLKIDKDNSNNIKKMTIKQNNRKIILVIQKDDVLITTVQKSGKQTTKMKLSKFINL